MRCVGLGVGFIRFATLHHVKRDVAGYLPYDFSESRSLLMQVGLDFGYLTGKTDNGRHCT